MKQSGARLHNVLNVNVMVLKLYHCVLTFKQIEACDGLD